MTILGTAGGDAKTIFETTLCPTCDETVLWSTCRIVAEPDLTKQYTWEAVCPNSCPTYLTAKMCCLTLHGEFS